MFVARERIHHGFAADRTHADRRDFVVEVQPLLRYECRTRQFAPRVIDIIRGSQDILAFAVVAEAAGLEDQWEPDRIHCRMQVLQRVHRAITWQGDLQFIEQALFVESVLSGTQGRGGWKDGNVIGDRVQRFDGHVLEFVGNDVAGGGEFRKRGGIVERAADYLACGGCRRRVGRVHEVTLDTHSSRSKAKHLAELPGADNADTHGRD